MRRRTFLAGLGATGLALAFGAPALVRAAADTPLKFGILTGMTGIFSDGTGKGSVVGAQIVIEEFGGKVRSQQSPTQVPQA